jgi:hypothetical protein
MRGLHDLLRQLNMKCLPDDAIPICGFGGEDAGVMKLGVVSTADDMFHCG